MGTHMNTIEIRGLKYSYGKNDNILKGIDLSVPKGSIFGLLGKNGAGKTTTLRLALGLIKMQEGDIQILGKSIGKSRIELLQNVGSLIESPSFYAHLSATENLRILQLVYGCPESRIGEVLNLVGLADTGKKKVGQFSLGMKQRLSIAIALLHNPELLILDEPTNGLDPNGIVEMRELLKKLNEENGVTIVISSHLLAEIEKIISHLAIIDHGAVVFQGKYSELKDLKQKNTTVIIETGDVERSKEIIKELGFPEAKEVAGGIQLEGADKKELAAINKQLVSRGIDVYQLKFLEHDLESIFINLTKNN